MTATATTVVDPEPPDGVMVLPDMSAICASLSDHSPAVTRSYSDCGNPPSYVAATPPTVTPLFIVAVPAPLVLPIRTSAFRFAPAVIAGNVSDALTSVHPSNNVTPVMK